MCRLLVLFAIALAPCLELAAQDVVPDTTSPARYAPLHVGNVWHYYDNSILSTRIQARRVLRDSTVNDTVYAVVEVYTDLGAHWDYQTSVRMELLRFDSTRALLLQRNGNREAGAFYAPCALDAPFPGPNGAECYTDGERTGWVVRGGYEERVQIGDSLHIGPAKGFDSLGGWAEVAADIGIVGSGADGSTISTLLAYAVVDGKTYGAPIEGLPVIVSSPASPTTTALVLRAFPSPTSGYLTLALDLPAPQPVELAAFDALGRRVWHRELAISDGSRVEIDASAWVPGLYVVRALAGDASATTTVIRR